MATFLENIIKAGEMNVDLQCFRVGSLLHINFENDFEPGFRLFCQQTIKKDHLTPDMCKGKMVLFRCVDRKDVILYSRSKFCQPVERIFQKSI